MSALFPGSQDAHGFWRDILAGRDLITDVPATRWLIEDHYDPDPRAVDKTYCKRGAFLQDIEFDPMEFGIPPTAIAATDTSQLLALIVAKRVLEDALGSQFQDVDRSRASVILGVTSGQELICEAASRLQRPVWLKALRESGIPEDQAREICERISSSYTPWQENTFPGLLGNVVAGRIANRFDLGGANFITDAACASSLAAVGMAMGELQLGNSDLVIAGGVDTFNDIPMYVCFSKTPALSPTGDCRPFAKNADGTVLGEGLGMVALKRLGDAERDGNRIYAVIRGIGSGSDGRSKSIYAPRAEGQARTLRRAYESAGYGPETVELVEAHGTGTAAGDTAEFAALNEVFGSSATGAKPGTGQWCALGSVKSQVGHTKAAAGAAGLFKIVMALHQKTLPPTLKAEESNPDLDLPNSPFYLNARARPWVRGADHPRRASLSSFGFGGTNFHLALEEYTGDGKKPPLRWTPPSELALLSAASRSGLRAEAERIVSSAGRSLAHVARQTQDSFDCRLPYRLAVVAESFEDLRAKLRAVADGIAAERDAFAPGVFFRSGEPAGGGVAFLFPGQASQFVGMTGDVAMMWPEARAVWDRAPDIARLVFPAPPANADEAEAQRARLTATDRAQPAIGVASAAILNVLRKAGLRADAVAGHSFGEIPALYAAGWLDFEAMLKTARRRGELLAEASPVPAGMLSVRMEEAELARLIGEWGLDLEIANRNAPRQNVLSGAAPQIEQARRKLAQLGAQVTPLPVSTAFHSPLMAPAAGEFRRFLDSVPFEPQGIAFYSNFHAGRLEDAAPAARRALAELICGPVRFAEMIRRMHEDGSRTFIEVGPGGVLTPLVAANLEGLPHVAIACDRPGVNGVTSLWHALGRLAVEGHELNLRALREGYELESDNSAAKNRFAVSINGGNYARPYPPQGGAAALPKPVPPGPPERAAQPAAPSPAAPSDALEAYRVFQESVTNAHRLWQENLAQGHRDVVSALQNAYFAVLGRPAPELPAMEQRTGLPVTQALPAPPPAPLPSPFAAPPPSPEVAAVTSPIPVAAPVPAAPPAQEFADARTILWSTVAEKTGYPTEMLEASMALEADLGIDSIKRVEIFSAMQERFAPLAELDQTALSQLRTLGDIVTWIESFRQGGTQPAAAKETSRSDAKTVVLQLIAEKTGYPAEMLEASMALEADLGIDSIKRVEIFSALQESYGEAANLDQAELVKLRTIGDIVGWLDSFSTPGSEPAEEAPELRQVLRMRPAPAIGYSIVDADDGPIAIVGGGEVAGKLAQRLTDSGYPAEAVAEVHSGCRAVIFLGGITAVSGPAEALEAQKSAFLCAKAIAAQMGETGGLFVTVQDTGGEFAPASMGRAWSGGLSGLAKTAALEWPRTRVKAIDIAAAERSADEIAAALQEELLEGGPEREIGLRNGVRITPELQQEPARGAALELPDRPFLIATGGARGVTATALIALARGARPRVLILGRTAQTPEPACCAGVESEPELKRALVEQAKKQGRPIHPAALAGEAARVLAAREIQSNLEELKRAGAEVRYAACDIRDARGLHAAIEDARREWGPVHGVIHGAGTLADRLIRDLSPEQFEDVFSVKVAGLDALLSATAGDPLSFIAIFSSVAARYGNQGQAAYAAANETLNRMAHAEWRRRGGNVRVKAMNWGPWDGGMVTPGLRRQFEERGVRLISAAEGGRLFVDEIMRGGNDDVEVVLGAPLAPATAQLRVVVNQRTFPVLADHQIQDVPVFPVVGALDLFIQASGAARPAVWRDLKVLKGIRLDGFTNGGNLLTVQAGSEGRFEIVGRDGARHYEAVLSHERQNPRGSARPRPLSGLEPAPWGLDEIYGRLLFHGPAFHAVRELEGISQSGIRALLAGRTELGWPKPLFVCDAALLDGGLQLARLWGYHALNRLSLPTAIGSFEMFEAGGTPGTAICEVHAKPVTQSKFLCDIDWTTTAGEPLASMRNVEMHTLPDSHG